jgi:hypothetical protein
MKRAYPLDHNINYRFLERTGITFWFQQLDYELWEANKQKKEDILHKTPTGKEKPHYHYI